MSGLRVLVAGSGAREHALAWRLAAEAGVERVICAPGNALMSDVADVQPTVSVADQDAVVELCRRARVDLVVVGPEAPLVDGLADRLIAGGVAVFGPTRSAAQLEGSKSFCRAVCEAAGVPMAEGQSFDAVGAALDFAQSLTYPLVVKADGLAAGKGVVVCATPADAERHVRDVIENGRFGPGRRVVVERLLAGVEASVIAITDGEEALLLPAARDHKRLHEGDTGPNTGGMGAYSPLADLDEAALASIEADVFRPVLAEMARRGTPFRGALFAGLMLTAGVAYLLEFNARFGDPETQVILPRLESPLAPLLTAAAEGRLRGEALRVSRAAAVGVTLAAAGYPEAPRAGDPILGIDGARAAGALVFGAGVRRETHDGLVTAGGRVLTIVGLGHDLEAAAALAHEAAAGVSFAGKVMRRDIGRPATMGAAA